ncbi:MAG: hypothetical protein OEM22_05245 [Acidimicrobiia bacterium]|nr:hypothetical protein [Acidimicrobiia bacterium]
MAFMKSLAITALVIVLAVAMTVPAAAIPDHATGLDRAREMSQKSFDKVRGKSADAPGQNKADQADKLTGRDRALASILKGLEKGNGNGNAFGRGHSADVLGALLAGDSPSELASHGEKVSAMVKAFNALKKAEKAEEADSDS